MPWCLLFSHNSTCPALPPALCRWAEPEAVVKAAHVMLERAWASYRDFLAGGGSLEPEDRRYHDRETLLECFSLMNAFLAQVTTFAWWPPLR